MPDPELQLVGLDQIRILYENITRMITRHSGENDNKFVRRTKRRARSFQRRVKRLLRHLPEGCFLNSLDEIAITVQNVIHRVIRQKGESDIIFGRRAKEEVEQFQQEIEDLVSKI